MLLKIVCLMLIVIGVSIRALLLMTDKVHLSAVARSAGNKLSQWTAGVMTYMAKRYYLKE